MSDNYFETEKSRSRQWSLQRFIDRAVALGIDDIDGLCDLIPDAELRIALQGAASVHPMRGRSLSIEDLVSEMRRTENSTVTGEGETC